MNWNKWVRQTHGWLSVAFTVAVIINIVAIAQKKYTNQLGLLAVFPLAFLLLTGLYLFVLPYFHQLAQRAALRLNRRPPALSNAALRRYPAF